MWNETKEVVCRANMQLAQNDLVTLTWGNVSAFLPEEQVVVIKPSGVSYESMCPEQMVVADMDGNIVEGTLRPSSDLMTHLEIYRSFPEVRGVAHTHSISATIFSQALTPIPCLGTTHADTFYGEIPVTRKMTNEEIQSEYEKNTGKLIVETITSLGQSPLEMPGVLVASHGPFTWGDSPLKASENSLVLEQIARMAIGTFQLNPQSCLIEKALLDKHFFRKHGTDAYYGQES
jgi:L-ribulose-5-phosphate 4-epimerase